MKTFRTFLKTILGNDSGFSIVQGLAVAAALGGVSLALLQQNKISNQQSRTAATSVAVLELQGQIQNYLLQDTSCKLSLQTPQLTADNQAGSVLAIKNNLGIDVLVRGETYLNNQVQIESMNFTRLNNGTGTTPGQGELVVVLNKRGNANNRGSGGAQVRKVYPLSAKWDGSGNLIKCYSDISNAVDNAVDTVLARICKDSTNVNGMFFDTAAGFCQLTPFGVGSTAGTDMMSGECPINQAVREIQYDPTTRKYTKVCGKVYANMPDGCPPDSFLRQTGTGQFECVQLNCSNPNQIFQGFNNGVPVCLSCGAGQGAQNVNGVMTCVNLSCGANKFFVGTNSQGMPICNDLVDTSASSCSGPGKLVTTAGGSVKFECCTASCGDAPNYCSGTPYPSSNSCGVCIGTKAAACGDPSTQCQGSYPSSNGCGTCTGTKLPQAGVWSNWVASSEFRPKSGATCSCSTNTVTQERKYTRACTQPTCGGAACNGLTEEWRDEGTQACTPSGCVAAGKCTGSGYDASNMFVSGGADTGQCSTYRYQIFDIVVSQFKVGNIYSVTRGQTIAEEAKVGDSPRMVLDRMAAKINSTPISATGACGTSNNQATVLSANRIQLRFQWQHSAAVGASRSCNIADQATCSATPGCSWDTTSANLCTGMNYYAKVGVCNGTYYQQGCKWDGYTGNSGNEYTCQYNYDTQAECNAAYSNGCSWGSIAQTCYASTQSDCTSKSGCTWKAYPDEPRSCTAAWESACKGDGAGSCTWGPR